jgi:hypothetical protein
MSRRALGRWGWDLDEWDFNSAVAALGVLVPLLHERDELRWGGPPARSRGASSRTRRKRKTAHYRLLLDEAKQLTGPLVWDVAPLGLNRSRRSALLARLPPIALAAAWSTTTPTNSRNLEVHPAGWLQTAWILETLSPAAKARIPYSAAETRSPYVPLPERGGRLRWNWPVRVGFLQSWLRDFLYARLPDYLANLTEPEIDPSRCDLLISSDALEAIKLLDRSQPPEATLVVLLDNTRPAQGLEGLPQLAARVRAKGVAVVRASDWQVWYRAFVRELSHAHRLTECLPVVGGVAAVFATPSLADARPLGLAISALAGRMVQAEAVHEVALTFPENTEAVFRMPGRPLTVREVGRRLLEEEVLNFASEMDGSTHVLNVDRAARPVLEEAERSQTGLRFIRAQVHDLAREGRPALRWGFQAGATHHVVVSIGPKDAAWLAGNLPFPVEKLPPDASGHRLTVVFSEPNLLRRPLVDSVELPPFGPSSTAVFSLPVERDVSTVEARIVVLHRGRILQTALLRGEVFSAEELERLEAASEGPAIQVLVEAMLRPGMAGLDDRTGFHAAMVLNHDREGRSLVEFIREGKAAILSLNNADQALQDISRTLERAEQDKAFERVLASKASMAYLSELAEYGTVLYQRVGQRIESTLADQPLERIQVLSADPNTFLPVEVIYDLPPPGEAPRLCKNWEKALQDGRCNPSAFHKVDEEGLLDVVCPIGFWGVSKVIEREAVDPSSLAEDPETRGIQFAVISAPDRQRSTLGGLTPVLFAASEHMNDVEPKELDRVTKSLRSLSRQQLDHVHTWKQWAGRVKTNDPPLLLLLAHTELNSPKGAALEIAKRAGLERRRVGQITRRHVNPDAKRPGPIVMLLGCTTAVPQKHFQSFVVQFYERGASLVLGTIAPVLGRHAGRTAEALIEQLLAMAATHETQNGRGMTIGDAMLAIRQQLLAKGILMALSLTAYGDADWRLPAKR